MFKGLKLAWKNFKLELKTYQLVIQDSRTPRISKWLFGIAIAYALSPIDFIPDFIPVIGLLDDAVIVPLLVVLALKVTPREIVEDCRFKAKNE
jgi:uncharacterized membrane protein YkvA (DUF1232 family)